MNEQAIEDQMLPLGFIDDGHDDVDDWGTPVL
jgi:hypothetical protein